MPQQCDSVFIDMDTKRNQLAKWMSCLAMPVGITIAEFLPMPHRRNGLKLMILQVKPVGMKKWRE
jgi:hypothetical protein